MIATFSSAVIIFPLLAGLRLRGTLLPAPARRLARYPQLSKLIKKGRTAQAWHGPSGRRSGLELEAECSPDQGKGAEHTAWGLYDSNLVRILAEQHGHVDGRARLRRREVLDLALSNQRLHLTEERLELQGWAVDVDDAYRLLCRVAKRLGSARGRRCR